MCEPVCGICNYCGRHANRREREAGWAAVQVGVTKLQMHHKCAEQYRAEGMMPGATFSLLDEYIHEQVLRALGAAPHEKRRYPEGKLWFGVPREGQPLNFN